MEQEIYYDGYTLDGELNRFFKLWMEVLLSLSYAYAAAKLFPKAFPRLIAFLPVVSLFFFLPLHLHSIHLGGATAFFIAWLTNFKLLLLAFNLGPLSDQSLTLPKFLTVACFPIKIQHHRRSKPKTAQNSAWNFVIKLLIFASLMRIYDFRELMNPNLIRMMYFAHIYLVLELMLAMVAGLVQVLLGSELEPQFNKPYLSTSLQDFWGRRWNVMVSRILRPIVYDPCVRVATRIMDRKWAAMAGVIATFAVSGVMHEVVFFYLRRSKPTWELTWFFVFHGVCWAVEIAAKKAVGGRFKVARMVATAATAGFFYVTGIWWFLPELFRCHAVERAFMEYEILRETLNFKF